MNKEEFLKRLEQLLSDISEEESGCTCLLQKLF